MSEAKQRLLASYGRRRGRKLRPSGQARIDTQLPSLSIEMPEGNAALNPAALFPKSYTEYWLEIGFGGGEHMAAQALASPHAGIIGCEPYINGLVSLLGSLDEKAIHNVRLYPGDARLLMERLPPACLCRVFILFPDPWPKTRHHKRRLIQQPFLDVLARLMKPGASLLLATDHPDYLAWMLEQLLACPHFEWTARKKSDWENPPEGWVRTRYQEKAAAQGRVATYLLLRRV